MLKCNHPSHTQKNTYIYPGYYHCPDCNRHHQSGQSCCKFCYSKPCKQGHVQEIEDCNYCRDKYRGHTDKHKHCDICDNHHVPVSSNSSKNIYVILRKYCKNLKMKKCTNCSSNKAYFFHFNISKPPLCIDCHKETCKICCFDCPPRFIETKYDIRRIPSYNELKFDKFGRQIDYHCHGCVKERNFELYVHATYYPSVCHHELNSCPNKFPF